MPTPRPPHASLPHRRGVGAGLAPRRRLRARAFLACALLALGAGLHARVDPVFLRHDRSLAQAAELAAEFPAALRVGGDGSGTLIAPRWVLTAAHVADALSPFTPRVHAGERSYAVRHVYLHPRAITREFGTPPDVDLALLELAEPVDGVQPAELVDLARAGEAVGAEVILVGHGDHALAGAPPSPPDGVARAATNVVDRVDDEGRLFLRLDRDGTELEGVGAPGDSGGPLLLRDARGVRVLGVSSGGFGPMGEYGMQDMYAGVPRHREWIEATQRAAAAGEAAPASWSFADGPRDTPVGRVTAELLAALAAESADVLTDFAARRRSDDERAFESDADWVRFLRGLPDALESLRPRHYAERDARAVLLLRAADGVSWVQLELRLLPDGEHALVFVMPGEAPAEPASDD